MDLRIPYHYTRESLYCYRRSLVARRMHADILNDIARAGLLHYRGSRGGCSCQRPISVIVSYYHNRSPDVTKQSQLNGHVQKQKSKQTQLIRTLVPFPREIVSPWRSIKSSSFPVIYVINASSLAKLHAMEQLRVEIESYSIDLAFVTETHFKKKHSSEAFLIPGYNCIRRDREGRRGGGVAFFVRDSLTTNGPQTNRRSTHI